MKTITKTDHNKQATDFLKKTGATLEIKYLRHGKHFPGDKDNRDIYKFTIKRGKRSYSGEFGNSLNDSIKYEDKLNGNIFFSNMRGANNNLKIVDKSYIDNHCRVIAGEAPTEYEILACLQKYDIGTFEDFVASLDIILTAGRQRIPIKQY